MDGEPVATSIPEEQRMMPSGCFAGCFFFPGAAQCRPDHQTVNDTIYLTHSELLESGNTDAA